MFYLQGIVAFFLMRTSVPKFLMKIYSLCEDFFKFTIFNE